MYIIKFVSFLTRTSFRSMTFNLLFAWAFDNVLERIPEKGSMRHILYRQNAMRKYSSSKIPIMRSYLIDAINSRIIRCSSSYFQVCQMSRTSSSSLLTSYQIRNPA